MPSLSQCAPFVIVAVVVACDLLCVGSASTVPSTSTESNVWIKRQNSSNIGTWQGPPTTPWPALGARRSQNQPAPVDNPTGMRPGQNQNILTSQNQNQNVGNTRNVGLDLSYGLNAGGNAAQKGNRGSSGNIGIDLSYGLSANRNSGGSNQNKNTLTSSQNFAKAAQGSLTSQNQQITNRDRNNQNVLNIPSPKPTTQTSGQTTTTSRLNNIQTSNTMPGPLLQTGNKTSSPVLNEDEELREFSETLLRKDVNNAAKYVTINYQGKTTSRSMNDEAPLPLLSIKKEAYDIPSIANLLALHNNYILETNVNEHVSAQEKMEENALLDTILSTPIMQHTRNFLISKGAISRDPKDFKDKLRELWFNMYSRGKGKIGSSGFEHVFLAELKNEDVSGLHNWLYFHDAEAKHLANYLGYLKKFDIGDDKGAIVKYHFTLGGKDKPVGSMFVGTSPELEVALYSTCFLLRADKVCPLRFGGKNFIIRTYTFRYRGKNLIGSAFPEI